jgi:peroxiredoxin
VWIERIRFCNVTFQSHLPGYVSASSEISAKGVDEVICVSCNDPFVHSAWVSLELLLGVRFPVKSVRY